MSNYHCMNLETLTPNIQISKSLLQRGLFIHWALTPNWERNILFLFSVTKIHFCVPATTTTAATVSISCFFFPNKYWMCCAATTVTEEMPGRHGKMDGRGSCSRWWRSLQTYIPVNSKKLLKIWEIVVWVWWDFGHILILQNYQALLWGIFQMDKFLRE